ncbi:MULTISPECIES: protein-export chaperone SecB [Celeribacter]|jgi:preprotein translocase subunit SecB|uniref:Protein-export protein SecB n=1 Tax=Celeribacter halophilus TaxID=576117 RepID=A0A1I3TU33_9RHOB|nr:protein-export chaperone SecB [Celeribacter halophilus]MBU2889666.1 protein-export chaperone SecB [Celeribacter halophilus]MDO6456871.1 protein-export chaperone SecB [Celeribacter halophilus]MDO6510691.1 protein-export chaperone SecB [Celeribacter halophilus]MDO6723533.1 protein-export chaperone SecB [Celeribacter halophilus]PZX10690.1 protein translocase subunit secB [Celeribacter halophilus]
MAENGTTAPKPEAAAQPNPVKMQILGQFIRDMSFENILAQKSLKVEGRPAISVQVALDAKKREEENQFEVATKVKVESKTESGDATLFILELDYAGVFHIENVPDEQMHPFLMIECPRMLFPFLRRVVNDVTRDGGFPPLNLDNIDFVQLYRQDMARRAEAQKAAATPN